MSCVASSGAVTVYGGRGGGDAGDAGAGDGRDDGTGDEGAAGSDNDLKPRASGVSPVLPVAMGSPTLDEEAGGTAADAGEAGAGREVDASDTDMPCAAGRGRNDAG